jgi:hypothetical protein
VRTPVERALGAGRLLLVSSTVLALALGAHTLGGGRLPGGPVVAGLGALLLATTAWTARGRLRVRSLLPTVLAAEAGLHVALTWLTTGTGSLVAADGHHHGFVTAQPVVGAAVATHAHGVRGPMLLAHLAATVLTVGLLVATDRAGRTVAHLWTWLLPALLRPAVPTPARPRDVPVPGVASARHGLRPTRTLRRRGPPLLAPLC